MLIAIAAAIAMLLLGGCESEGKKLQQELAAILSQEQQLSNYRFSGSAQLSLPAGAWGGGPFARELLSLAQDIAMEWRGTAYTEPQQVEAAITLKTASSAASTAIPVLIKDNKLYFHIPQLNEQDEYFSWDLPEPGLAAAYDAHALSAAVGRHLVAHLQPRWFKEGGTNPDHPFPRSVAIEIPQKDAQELLSSVKSALPEMIAELQEQHSYWVKPLETLQRQLNSSEWAESEKRLKLSEPAVLAFTFDEAGTIIRRQFKMDFRLPNENGESEAYRIHFDHRLEQINEDPPLTESVPEKVLSLEKVLEQLARTQKPE
jgi:hypothetical protein